MDVPAGKNVAPYSVQKIRGYCAVDMGSKFADISWADLQDSTSSMIDEIKSMKTSRVLVDLTHLEHINSGLIAVLLRIWKTLDPKTRRLSVVSSSDSVHHVLKVAGLNKLWTIVETREEGTYELGYSHRSDLEQRELRILALAALPFAVLAAISVVPIFRESSDVLQTNSQLAALLLGVVSLTAGVFSIFKDTGVRRVLSGVAIVISLCVLSTLIFEGNPISFRSTVQPTPVSPSE